MKKLIFPMLTMLTWTVLVQAQGVVKYTRDYGNLENGTLSDKGVIEVYDENGKKQAVGGMTTTKYGQDAKFVYNDKGEKW